ncbi:Ribonuclease H [Alkaliphilus metalliredigens QYMF]|uniref:Ribonuclease HII n=1 Tax=Alkaliphilus metalliredigens (strain QYMF) TaxID=293826 RepID=RNH2_ALKMQ|nr:ribonuclease HII [Alkaliphilus metalliredigens]A6TRS3.1 RecName: Full=Ribonuclease HII; Short=RNase HII [Alkaliphilus metalliredigens QYMF]ABR48891.1 Ribonuclease H [Alkaliphilus metalliredigens QYMF]
MNRLEIENQLWEEGYESIAGCDEVGRGCLFGSVLAATVILPKGLLIEGVKDSKKLSPKRREELYEVIKKNAIAMGVGIISAEVIDQINIRQASRLAMKKSVLSLTTIDGESKIPDYILVDAENIDIAIPQSAIIKGDDRSQGIAAASIVAKVIRDRLCIRWDEEYPNYGIAQHKGYGTKLHREALLKYGPSELHRRSFLKKILK